MNRRKNKKEWKKFRGKRKCNVRAAFKYLSKTHGLIKAMFIISSGIAQRAYYKPMPRFAPGFREGGVIAEKGPECVVTGGGRSFGKTALMLSHLPAGALVMPHREALDLLDKEHRNYTIKHDETDLITKEVIDAIKIRNHFPAHPIIVRPTGWITDFLPPS